MTELHIEQLILKRYRKEPLNIWERADLEEWAKKSVHNQELLDRFDDEQWVNDRLQEIREMPYEQIWNDIERRLAMEAQRRAFIVRRWKWAVAAAVIILIGISPAVQRTTSKTGSQQTAGSGPALLSSMTASVTAAVSGNYKSILTLGNGRSVYPDKNELSYQPAAGAVYSGPALSGSLEGGGTMRSMEGGAAGSLEGGGAIRSMERRPGGSIDGATIAYHTLAVGQAGPFKLLLPDGTMVWLNARSALSYPVAFTGSRRFLRLSGQARFEVAKDLSKPFIVQSKNMNTEALGTSFTVTAYPDEPGDKVTLWDGVVHVQNDKGAYLLKAPLQQAEAQAGAAVIPMQDVKDPAEATAWQRGVFHFSGTDMQGAMSQIARWYGMDIRYEGDVQHLKLRMEGDIGHDLSLKEMLGIVNEFEKNIAGCVIQGHTIIVSDTRTRK